MGKAASTEFFDGGLDSIVNNGEEMNVCSAQPTTYTEAITTYSLGDVALAGGDKTKAAGSPDGRKVTIAAKTINGDANGTGTHIAIVDNTNSKLLFVTTCTSVGISVGVDQDFSAWDILLRDPT